MAPRFWRPFAAGIPHAFFSLFYPDDCRVCAAPLVRFSRAPVCDDCLRGLKPLASRAQCIRCGLPFENELPLHSTGLCGLCRRGVTEFDWGRCFGAYEGALRRLIHLLKYDGMQPLAVPLAERLAPLLAQAGPVDLLVPVPLHRSRRRARGFNQSELLAAEISRCFGTPMVAVLLRRTRPTETQTGLTHRQRRLNVRGAFAVVRAEAVAGKHIALIDDVVTTGATAGACARVLKRAGAERVVVLALARARLGVVPIASEPAPPPGQPAASRLREAACGA